MQPERRCSRCGQVIPWGQVECPLGSPRAGPLWSLSRETFLAVLAAYQGARKPRAEEG